ncbi:MAG: YraN family protein [Patescibacteria group bacterium]
MWNRAKKAKEQTEKQKIGKIGEDSACVYLERTGFAILDRNYLKKWGEIDIVAKKKDKIHFVEVKSVSRNLNNVSDETFGREGEYRAEDNMHPWKLERLARAISSYLLDKNVSDETEWQLDLAVVYVDMDKRLSRVEILHDIVL